MKLLATLTLTALTSTVTIARADADAHDAPASDLRDENTALALSIGGALAGPALFVAGVAALDNSGAFEEGGGDKLALHGSMIVTGAALSLVGPSLGHWYAGKILTPGMAMRAGGLAVAAAGAAGVVGPCEIDNTCGAAIVVAGLATFVGGSIYDIVTAPGRVRERNARSMTIVPVVKSGGPGFAVVGSF